MSALVYPAEGHQPPLVSEFPWTWGEVTGEQRWPFGYVDRVDGGWRGIGDADGAAVALAADELGNGQRVRWCWSWPCDDARRDEAGNPRRSQIGDASVHVDYVLVGDGWRPALVVGEPVRPIASDLCRYDPLWTVPAWFADVLVR